MKLENNRAFTLIELIIVIALLAIIASIAVPSFTAMSQNNILKVATIEIAQEIRNTQQLAINYRVNVIFDLDIYNNTYSVRENRSPPKRFKEGQLSKDITITTNLYNPGYGGDYKGVRRIVYSPNGLPSRTGTIWISNQFGKTKRIVIAVGTGRVRIIE